jgi:beta-glucuronidase
LNGIKAALRLSGFIRSAALIILKASMVKYSCLSEILPVLLMLQVFFLPGAAGSDSGVDIGAASLRGPWLFFFAGMDSSRAFAAADTLPQCDTVALPHTFPRRDTTVPPPAGIGWYFKNIPVSPEMAGHDVFLEFDGVCLRAEIFVEGRTAGKSLFPYVPFRVDLTPFVNNKGRIRVAIRIDNRLSEREFPDIKANGWWQYGGLVRDVRLTVLQRKRIDRADIRTVHLMSDTFDLQVHLIPASIRWDSVVIAVSPDQNASPVRLGSMTGTKAALRCDALQPWTPDTPRLYDISLTPWFNGRPGDTMRLRRGFCQMVAQGPRLLLNGKPVYLRGMSRHDIGTDAHPLLDRTQRLRDLLELKTCGVNFLRIAHFPQARDIYELCDSLGMLVMDEIPVWKSDPKFLGSPEGRKYGAAYVRALIEAHGNHTSIVLWSLGNQFASYKDQVARYVAVTARQAKTADPSRMVTYCSYYYQWDKGFPYVDVISINEYFGWELASLPMLSMVLDKLHQEWPDKPFIISEFGPQAAYGLRNPQPQLAGIFRSVLSKDLSEDHQALYLKSHIDTIWSRRSFVNGMVVWAYADYCSQLNKARTSGMPVGLNACGIVTEDRKKKLGYEAVRERYTVLRQQWAKESGTGETGRATSQ